MADLGCPCQMGQEGLHESMPISSLCHGPRSRADGPCQASHSHTCDLASESQLKAAAGCIAHNAMRWGRAGQLVALRIELPFVSSDRYRAPVLFCSSPLLFCEWDEMLPLLLVRRRFFHARPGWWATHHGVPECWVTGHWPLTTTVPCKGGGLCFIRRRNLNE
jgi:hypothetical protein